jgi:hypothetical protein
VTGLTADLTSVGFRKGFFCFFQRLITGAKKSYVVTGGLIGQMLATTSVKFVLAISLGSEVDVKDVHSNKYYFPFTKFNKD